MTVESVKLATIQWWREARSNRLFWMAIIVAILVACLDQASKIIIVHVVDLPGRAVPCARAPAYLCAQIPVAPIFDLTFVKNYGASFGMLAGGLASRIFLSLLSITIVIGLGVWLGGLHRRVAASGVGFILGGALGNLYDRIAYGYVVDFLDFSGLYFPWVFNLADAAINVGVGLLLLDAWLTREKGAPNASNG